jgi:hypothetical protein
MNNITITLSDEQMTKIKVVDLYQLYNFCVYDFFNWNHLLLQNVVWSCYFLKFKFLIDKTKSHKSLTKIIGVRIQ